ncbi:MAG: helix-turn-helix domain-containing protein [Anaerolineales bacterium]|jgi:transcriptional regulator with XRE-family HTH domain
MSMFNDDDAISVDVGERLRALRTQRRLSLRALAHKSGLSANALSNIERGQTSATVSTLYKVADALGVSITAFFDNEEKGQEIVFRKASERVRVPFSRGLWEGLGGESFNGRVEPFVLTLESGANSGPFGIVHSGHEFVICLRGQLEYHVKNRVYVLDPGDSLLFAAQLPHRWRNPGNTVTNALFLLSDFEDQDRLAGFHTPNQPQEDQEA